MRRGRCTRAAVAIAVLVGASACFTSTSHAVPPSNDPVLDAEYGATWSAGQVNAQGFVPLPNASPNVTATIETALTLAAAKVEHPTFDRIMTWAQANAATVIVSGGADSPGTLGELLMLAHVAGIDPNNFGGVDLVVHLADTLGDFAPGLYGAQDPTFDGVYRQSLALLGIEAVGAAAPTAARDWLTGQQCTGAPAAAAGGWEAYRADTAVACVLPDPINFVGPDSNSTAIAVQALDALGVTGPETAALDFLAAAESSVGGFGYIPGGDDDPNSTALVLQAIVAGGENPQAGRWLKGSNTPVTALLTWQLGCSATVADRGAFRSPFSSNAPDAFATRQSVWGASLTPFPFPNGAFHTAAVPCRPATTTTSVTTLPSSSTAATGSTSSTTPLVVVPSATTVAVVATPVFTG